MTTEQPAYLESRRGSRISPALDRISNWPWWLLVAIFLGLIITYAILTNERYSVIFREISEGIVVTIRVTLLAYSLAISIGLLVGLGRVSSNKVAFNAASFYVEIIRGLPLLVLLLYIAFVGLPLLVEGFNAAGVWLEANLGFGEALQGVSTRDVSFEVRVIVGLAVAYGAFSAEIFRAGIQSIEKGQMEAARGLGMNYFQAMRHVILPQAIRRVMPALGNDFVAMVKDSSLVSVLGVRDPTQIAKLYASSTFLFFQTYSILAFVYLLITVMLTRVVRALERRLSRDRK